MKLKPKFVLASLFLLTIFLISSLLLYQFFLKEILLELEKKFVTNRIKQLLTYLEIEKEGLLGFTKDWAAWSEAYLFLKGKNPNFPKVNLTVESWTNNNLSILLYVDRSGNPLAGGFYDKKIQKVIPIDKSWVKEHWSTFLKFYPEPGPQTGYVGLSFYGDLPCIVAIHSVTTSDFRAQPVGFLITARGFTQEVLDLWIKLFEFQTLKFDKIPKEKRELFEISFKEEFIYEGKIFLEDFSQTLFLVISFQIFKILPLESYLLKLIFLQVAFLFFFFLVFFFYFKEFLVDRLLSLVKQISELREGRKEKIFFEGKDEIGLIVQELNQLYEKVKTQIKEIEEAKKIYQIIAERANMLIALLDERKEIVYLNPLAKRYLDSETLKRLLTRDKIEKDSYFQICSLNGNFLQVEVIPVKELSSYYLLIGYDVTYFKEKIDQLFEMSIKDFLTEVYNRRYLEEILKKLHPLVKRGEEKYAVLFIDLDDLKKINDTFGHLAGDVVLKRVAKVISENIRESDWVGRWGGDEFLVVIKGSLDEAKTVAERILKMVKDLKFTFRDQVIQTSVSIGIAPLEKDRGIEETIKIADKLAYESKRAGKGGVKVANFL
ncbi:MAG: diguanylate cyclase [Thermodesulfobacteriaceae bacterium]|nr:diguanylate cyclase [Thermodesulfobacteriaceae bacterium]